MTVRSPVLGYNTNVRHAGRLYHIQTEDSGLKHPHVITHLFADGGRIVASTKSSYAEHLGAENLHDLVKAKMREQHKAMFIALRDGHYDDAPEASDAAAPAGPKPTATFERPGFRAPSRPPQYQPAPSARPPGPPTDPAPRPRAAPSITLDEVILSYLAEDLAAGIGAN